MDCLLDSLAPRTPAVRDNCRIELLGGQTVAFRSFGRIHLWRGRVYRDIAAALSRRVPTQQIVAELAQTRSRAEVLWALHQLSRYGLIGELQSPGDPPCGSAAMPEVFGDLRAPYRTCIGFQPRPLTRAPEGGGDYVFGKHTSIAEAQIRCRAEAEERGSLLWSDSAQAVRLSPNDIGSLAFLPEQLLPPGEAVGGEPPSHWTPVESLTSGATRYLPAAFCYFGFRSRTRLCRSESAIRSDSTGCAAGPTENDAVLSGFFELIERHALRRWWSGEQAARALRLDSLNDRLLLDVREYLRSLRRTLAVFDIGFISSVPAFAAVFFEETGRGVLGVAAHFDAHTALTAAVLEAGMALNWWLTVRCGSRALQPAMTLTPEMRIDALPSTFCDSLCARHSDAAQDLDRAVALLNERGQELLVLDLTQPGAALKTVRVTVPGLLRFNPESLYRLYEPAAAPQ